MMDQKDDDQYDDAETERRAREAIRRSFEMPHKPQRDIIGKVDRAKSPRSRKPPKSVPEDR